MAEGKERKAERLSKVEWHAAETVVDVGGGNGTLLLEVLGDRPDVRGIVLRPAGDGPRRRRVRRRRGVRRRSFFERVPPGDTYVLSGILHDWDDERASAILRTIRSAARPDARLLVAESVIQPGNDRKARSGSTS